jgi:signal transduction histidine kinase/integral membrane sensor domain MASE1
MRFVRVEHTSARPSVLGIVLGVCAGYYAASVLGLQLRLPSVTPSVLWPPNAILTSALLLTPPTRWPIVFLAALPAHLVVQLPTEWPLSMILAVFLTNCLEALIAAGGIWFLSDAPSRFDTFRRLVIFLFCAAVTAPVLSSFADAAAVHWFQDEPYWQVYGNRLFSNILSALTVVPAVVGLIVSLPNWFRRPSIPRTIEAAVLGFGLIALAIAEFNNHLPRLPALSAVSSQTPLAVQLPFLLWAAVRFGPTGASVALLVTSLLTAWTIVHGLGPFASMSPRTTIAAVRLFLIVVAVTLMCFSVLIEERRHSQRALADRLRFEELLSRLSGAFVHLPSDRMDRALDAWLGRIGSFLHLDFLGLVVASDRKGESRALYWWTDPALETSNSIVPRQDFHRALDRLLERRLLDATPASVVSFDAVADSDALQALGLQGGLAVPLVAGDQLLGVLASGSASASRESASLNANLRLVGEVLANVLARKQTEDALRLSELMKSAILQSLTSGVVVVNRAGSILALNETWTRLAAQCGCVNIGIGGNLVEAARTAGERGNQLTADLARAITTVLENPQQHRVVMEHMSETGADTRWWSVQVVPLNSADGGAVVTRTEVTDLRRAALEAQRSRQELAHVGRVSTVGELTASLAHQLNQPLAAIMTNAQAARRMLEATTPDIAEIRAILLDIVKDDRRASDVIQRLRDLLRKGELEMTQINLTAAIREVADLVSSEAIIRDVTVSLDLDPDPVFVRGDRVQLQQVVLNLMHNAMEAMADQHDRARVLHVRCHASDGESIHLSVGDSGPGLRAGAEETIFEPFFTTKPGGMGMGLSIVRSIVEAHGGCISAANGNSRGAIFELILPALASVEVQDTI